MYYMQPTSISQYREIANVSDYRSKTPYRSPTSEYTNLVAWNDYDEYDDVEANNSCRIRLNGQDKYEYIYPWSGLFGLTRDPDYDVQIVNNIGYGQTIARVDLYTSADLWEYSIPNLYPSISDPRSSEALITYNVDANTNSSSFTGIYSITLQIRPVGYIDVDSGDLYTLHHSLTGVTTVEITAAHLHDNLAKDYFTSAISNKWGHEYSTNICPLNYTGNSIIFWSGTYGYFFRATPIIYKVNANAGFILGSRASIIHGSSGAYSPYGNAGATHGYISNSVNISSHAEWRGYIPEYWPVPQMVGVQLTIPAETDNSSICINEGNGQTFTLNNSVGSSYIKFN